MLPLLINQKYPTFCLSEFNLLPRKNYSLASWHALCRQSSYRREGSAGVLNYSAEIFLGGMHMVKIKVATALCSLALAFAGITAGAEQYQSTQYDRPGYGRGHGGHNPGRPGPGYRLSWQYAGQISAPKNGAPGNWHNINYCGTEYPRECWNYGNTCYVNNGYWWDQSRGHNWFNYYECR